MFAEENPKYKGSKEELYMEAKEYLYCKMKYNLDTLLRATTPPWIHLEPPF